MSISKVAYLGLGIMGSAMAANLARAGFEVAGWNRTQDAPGAEAAQAAGCVIAASADAAVRDAQVVLLCLSDEKSLDEVLFERGAAKAAAAGTIFIDTSTTGPLCARNVAQRLHGMGQRFLDAPVSGGDVGARNGTLTFMVGGEQSDFDACIDVFRAMGKTIKHCGGHGSGQAVKLCNQILCAVNMVAVCESVELARALGIDPKLMVEVCSTGAAGSWALTNLGTKVADADFAPGFMLKHMLKDLRLVAEAAGESNLQLPGTMLATANFEQSRQSGGAGADEEGTQAMIRAYGRLSAKA